MAKAVPGKTVQAVRRLLLNSPMTLSEIAAHTGVTLATVQHVKKAYNIAREDYRHSNQSRKAFR